MIAGRPKVGNLAFLGPQGLPALHAVEDIRVQVRYVTVGEVQIIVCWLNSGLLIRDEAWIAHTNHVTSPIVKAGGPGGAASDFSEFGCLVGVGDDYRTAFPDEAMASRGCRARYRARNCAQWPT